MGFWPFGRDNDVEMASRVITAMTKNGFRVRGKLTIHFADQVTQEAADKAAAECAEVAEGMLREAESHETLIGSEPEVSGMLLARYPMSAAAARSLEVAALHVVGDPALSGALRRASSGSMQAVRPSPSATSSPLPKPPSAPPPAMPRRRASSQMRAIRITPLPAAASPAQAAALLAPIAHDAATRLLIGFLRAHDLIGVRNVEMDAASVDMLIPQSEAAPGGYEASRSDELARWQTALGAGSLRALRREAHLLACYMAEQALLRAGIPRDSADLVLVEVVTINIGDAEARAELGRFPDQLPPDFSADVVSAFRLIVRGPENPAAMSAALAPLVGQVDEDLTVAARVMKPAVG
jgi:hypothetical protein